MLTPKSFYLIRHGQTDYNLHSMAGGNHALEINATGEAQAKALAPKISELPFTKIISSPFIRALKTTELAIGKNPVVEPGIREWEVGDHDGMPMEAFEVLLESMPAEVAFPNGESKAQFFERVIEAVNRLLETHGENLVIVCHAGVHWVLMEHLQLEYVPIGNAQIARFEAVSDGNWEHTILH